MMNPIPLLTACLALCLASPGAATAPAKSYPLPGHGQLELQFPADWRDSLRQPPGGLPPTLTFLPASGREFELLVTVLWSRKPDPDFNSPDRLEQSMLQMGRRTLRTSKEKALDPSVINMKGRGPIGFIYTLTDRAPAPGSFEYATQGVFAAGELQLNFTLLTHEHDSAFLRPTLKMLSTAKQVRPKAR
jgi:hypothetical protein